MEWAYTWNDIRETIRIWDMPKKFETLWKRLECLLCKDDMLKMGDDILFF